MSVGELVRRAASFGRDHARVLAAIVALAVGAASWSSSRADRVYESSAEYLRGGGADFDIRATLVRRAAIIARARGFEREGRPRPVIDASPGTHVVRVRVRGRRPRELNLIANTYAAELLARDPRPASSEYTPARARLVSGPEPALDGLLAAPIGLALGVAVALWLDRLRRRRT
jgi:hypothetical protein